jgi:peptidoglycan L-alanyl-D-glutamate endopeptidase CwlK
MFDLSDKSLLHLKGVHPILISAVKRATELSSQEFEVLEGLRTLEQQKLNFAKGVSKTLDSKHLIQPDGFGHAVDLVPLINNTPRWEWPLIYPIADAMKVATLELKETSPVKIRWGGVWDRLLTDLTDLTQEVHNYTIRHPGPDFLDGPHFELVVD